MVSTSKCHTAASGMPVMRPPSENQSVTMRLSLRVQPVFTAWYYEVDKLVVNGQLNPSKQNLQDLG